MELTQGGPSFACLLMEYDVEGRNVAKLVKVFDIGVIFVLSKKVFVFEEICGKS